MYGSRRNPEAAQRSLDRKKRDDEAPRLIKEIPRLESLALQISEGEVGVIGGVEHVWRVVVPSAPALFVRTCANRDCREGGHDLTSDIMRALRSGTTKFDGTDTCHGTRGSSECGFVLKYVATATYRPA